MFVILLWAKFLDCERKFKDVFPSDLTTNFHDFMFSFRITFETVRYRYALAHPCSFHNTSYKRWIFIGMSARLSDVALRVKRSVLHPCEGRVKKIWCWPNILDNRNAYFNTEIRLIVSGIWWPTPGNPLSRFFFINIRWTNCFKDMYIHEICCYN